MHTLKRFTENIGWLVIGTIISNIISIIISILIIRKLPVEDFGIYSLFMGSLSIISIFSINGILLALRRFIPELIQKQHTSFHKFIIIRLYIISLFMALVLIFIIFLYKAEVGKLLNINKFEIYYSIFIINIFLFLQATITQDVLVSLFEQKFIAIIGVISMVLRGILYAVLFSNLTIDLIFIIEAICIGTRAIPCLLYVYGKISILAKNNNVEIDSGKKKELQKRITRYTLLSTANEVGEGGFSQVSDYYFISAFLGPFAMGLYAFPYKLLSSIFSWIPVERMTDIFKLYFINKYYEKNEDSTYLTRMFNFLFKIYFLFYGIIIIGILSYQKLIQIYIFDSKYIETQLLLAIILIFYLTKALGFPTHIIIEIKEKIQYTLYAKIFAVFNVLAVIFILRYTNWNLVGVGLATGLSNFLRCYYLYLVIKKMSKVTLIKIDFVKAFALISITGLIMYSTSLMNDLISQILLPFIVGIISFLVLYRMIKPFNQNEEAILLNFFGKFSNKFNIISKILAFNHP